MIIRAVISLFILCGMAGAQEKLLDPRPRGFYGVDHDRWHHIYSKLRNRIGHSCCNGEECRPTQMKWVGDRWQVMVDGEWSDFDNDVDLLDAEDLARQGIDRNDLPATAHVCASKYSKSPDAIYCAILPKFGG